MAYFDYPNTRVCRPQTFEFGIRGNVSLETSPTSGPTQQIVFLGDRWVGSFQYPAQTVNQRAELDALLQGLRGQVHGFNLWNLARPVPRGTMRGAPTLSSEATRSTVTLFIQTTAGATLLEGDMIKVGSQLVMVRVGGVADGSGVLEVTVNVPMRATVAVGGAVVWERPTCKVVSQEPQILVPFAPGVGDQGSTQPPFGWAFVEVF